MIEFFSNIFTILALLIVIIVYIITYFGIMGKGNAKRFPYFGIISVIMSYMIYVFIKRYTGDDIGIIIWAILSILPSLAIATSLFFRRKGNLWVDFTSLIIVAVLGIIPLFSKRVYELDADISTVLSGPVDLAAVVVFASLILMISLAMVTFSLVRNRSFSYTVMDRELSNKISEISRQQNTYNAFSAPLTKILSEEMHTQMNQMKNEMKSEISRSIIRSQNVSKISKKGGNDIMVEIQKLNAMVRNLQTPQRGFTTDDFMRDVKHSLATPLSQIEINCSLLDTLKDPKDRVECIQRIKSITKVCQNIVSSYLEIASPVTFDESSPLPDAIEELLISLWNKSMKKRLSFEKNNLPETLPGYSVSVLTSMLLPLIQNAIKAAPASSTIEISYHDGESHVITIKNACDKFVPTKEQLKTPNFSSKGKHLGVGLSTVRNYLRLLKGGNLDFDIEGNIVVAIITLKKK